MWLSLEVDREHFLEKDTAGTWVLKLGLEVKLSGAGRGISGGHMERQDKEDFTDRGFHSFSHFHSHCSESDLAGNPVAENTTHSQNPL